MPLIFCKKCNNVLYKEDDIELKRYKNGDIKEHCNICSNEVFDIVP